MEAILLCTIAEDSNRTAMIVSLGGALFLRKIKSKSPVLCTQANGKQETFVLCTQANEKQETFVLCTQANEKQETFVLTETRKQGNLKSKSNVLCSQAKLEMKGKFGLKSKLLKHPNVQCRNGLQYRLSVSNSSHCKLLPTQHI
eukprot:1143043-Pelagomonas_calceolata.AAC.1